MRTLISYRRINRRWIQSKEDSKYLRNLYVDKIHDIQTKNKDLHTDNIKEELILVKKIINIRNQLPQKLRQVDYN